MKAVASMVTAGYTLCDVGTDTKHRKTVEALGLKKLNKTVVLPDNAATRGMVQQVRHLVKVEEEA